MESIRLKNEALEKYPSYVTEITVYDDRETEPMMLSFGFLLQMILMSKLMGNYAL